MPWPEGNKSAFHAPADSSLWVVFFTLMDNPPELQGAFTSWEHCKTATESWFRSNGYPDFDIIVPADDALALPSKHSDAPYVDYRSSLANLYPETDSLKGKRHKKAI